MENYITLVGDISDMVRKKSPFPEINWFEFQVLSQLMGKDRYGNQILLSLEELFGPDVVYSGKLYPTLSRLEKKGFISRKAGEGGTDSSRGVDPIYYSLTGRGRAEMQKATMQTAVTFFQGAFNALRAAVAQRVMEIIIEGGEPPLKVGVATIGSEKRLGAEAMEVIDEQDGIVPVLVYVDGLCGKCRLCYGGLKGGGPYTMVKATPEDLPLKDGYLDALLAVVLYREGPEWLSFMREALRTLKPGGRVVMVEFGKFNSFILEEIMNSFHRMGGAVCDLLEVDEATLVEPLGDMLADVSSERLNEMLIVHGKKA
jgi:PadR family transcriptional regulator PadR